MTRPDGEIAIEYGAIPNGREGYGWLPAIWINGRQRGDTYAARGMDRDAAIAAASEIAIEERDRHIGDWHITVEPRTVTP